MKKAVFLLLLLLTAVSTTFVYYATQQADINYYTGRKYFKKGQYESAIPFYLNALSKNPKYENALMDLAYSYQWTGRFREAIDIFQRLLALGGKDYGIDKSLAETYSWRKDYEQAEKFYRETIRKNPEDIGAYVSLAEILIWDKRYDEAAGYLGEAAMKNKDERAQLLYAKTFLYSGRYGEAKKVLEEILRDSPDDMKARVLLADAYAYDKDFAEAIKRYKKILASRYDRDVKVKLADTLSWAKDYDQALALYDELSREKEDSGIGLRKARVLGWARRYKDSLEAYREVLEAGYSRTVELEMLAKKAYWAGRAEKAINYYEDLIVEDSGNLEAMFDLSQLYSYQSMWEDALGLYEDILKTSPAHFRAEEGQAKSELISEHIEAGSGYEFFEADSSSRENDIKKHTFFNRLKFPLSYKSLLGLNYGLSGRSFSDFRDLTENSVELSLSWRQAPRWWLEGFCGLVEYNRGIETAHEFGGAFNFRVFDFGISGISYQRERLENNSTVIRDEYYRDNSKARIDLDVSRRLKLGAEHLYSQYSRSNYNNEPALDIKYYFSLEPKVFYIKYRCFRRDFDKEVSEYFSPRNFWAQMLAFSWRHFLSREEIFFGADDLYYGLSYEASIDSEDIASHKFSGEFVWDIDKRFQLKTEAQYVHSSASVYRDKRFLAGFKYFF